MNHGLHVPVDLFDTAQVKARHVSSLSAIRALDSGEGIFTDLVTKKLLFALALSLTLNGIGIKLDALFYDSIFLLKLGGLLNHKLFRLVKGIALFFGPLCYRLKVVRYQAIVERVQLETWGGVAMGKGI